MGTVQVTLVLSNVGEGDKNGNQDLLNMKDFLNKNPNWQASPFYFSEEI